MKKLILYITLAASDLPDDLKFADARVVRREHLGGRRVDLRHLLVAQTGQLERGDVLGELLERGRADDYGSHVLPVARPEQAELRGRERELCGQLDELLSRRHCGARPVARLEQREEGMARLLRLGLQRAVYGANVLARKRAAGERAVSEQHDAVGHARVQRRACLGRAVLLKLTMQHRKVVLDRNRLLHAEASAGLEQLAHADCVLV
mmetsp:Transcript_28264/g.71128  ORF Transcript_28264/g.71128 Transcript_28264/m.71128 type:complete len:208 (+) Transcript_28264:454-1077(+)